MNLRDDFMVLLTGYVSVHVAKLLGASWIGEGSKAFFLGIVGSAGGYLAKLIIDHFIKKYKQKKPRTS